ncbi:hypothetical protein M433DRAFT_454165 [Acidomyces richmondensis BFW]|nr:MAG: hypothetical protein FE78DRAFT_251449 [Acidomyces sp. 'richmondensis']KYG48052.1 hypothetical protein M433DRAFT_454165 [Acidomyces richmondensis BFW]
MTRARGPADVAGNADRSGRRVRGGWWEQQWEQCGWRSSSGSQVRLTARLDWEVHEGQTSGEERVEGARRRHTAVPTSRIRPSRFRHACARTLPAVTSADRKAATTKRRVGRGCMLFNRRSCAIDAHEWRGHDKGTARAQPGHARLPPSLPPSVPACPPNRLPASVPAHLPDALRQGPSACPPRSHCCRRPAPRLRPRGLCAMQRWCRKLKPALRLAAWGGPKPRASSTPLLPACARSRMC